MRIDDYVEPFAGGAALFFALRERGLAGQCYLGDANADLITLYKEVQTNVEELIALFDKVRVQYMDLGTDVERRVYYDLVRSWMNRPEAVGVRRAARLLFLNAVGFNGLFRVNSSGDYNVPFGDVRDERGWGKLPPFRTADGLRAASVALQGTVIRHCSYDEWDVGSDALVYVDPPYAKLDDAKGAPFTAYTAEGFDDAAQVKLAHWCKKLVLGGTTVIASNANCTFIRGLYGDLGFILHEVQATRKINRDADGRGPVGELIMVGGQ